MMLGLGGANAISAGFRVYLNDDFSRQADKVAAKMKLMKNEVALLRENLMGAKRLYTGLAAAALGATGGMLKLAMKGADFGFEMTKVKAITRGTIKELKVLDKLSKQLAGRTIFRPNDIASAMTYAARTGQSAGTIAHTITPATELAQATDAPLGGKGGTMDIQTNIMRGFNIADSKMRDVADVLTAATLSANTNLMDLGRAIKYTAATSMDMGTSLKQTTAMIMMLGDAGMQSSQAGTAVENMQRYFARSEGAFSTKAQAKAMAMLGYKQKDFKKPDGSLKDWGEIFSMLRKGAAGLHRVEKQTAFEKLFGTRGKRAGSVFIRMDGKYEKFLDILNNSSGMAQQVSKDMMDNLKGSWERTVSEWESFAASWSKALSPLLRSLMWLGRGLLSIINFIVNIPVLGPLISSIVVATSAFLALRWSLKALAMIIATMSGGRASLMGMRAAASGWIAGNGITSMQYGSGYDKAMAAGGATTKWSQKRGMYYSYGGAMGPGVRWHKKVPNGNVGVFGSLGKVGKFLPKIGRGLSFVGKFLGRLLPWMGLLIPAIQFLGPILGALGTKISDLIMGTDKQTKAIRAQYELFKGSGVLTNQQVLSAYANHPEANLIKDLTTAFEALYREGYKTNEILNDSREHQESMVDALQGISNVTVEDNVNNPGHKY